MIRHIYEWKKHMVSVMCKGDVIDPSMDEIWSEATEMENVV